MRNENFLQFSWRFQSPRVLVTDRGLELPRVRVAEGLSFRLFEPESSSYRGFE